MSLRSWPIPSERNNSPRADRAWLVLGAAGALIVTGMFSCSYVAEAGYSTEDAQEFLAEAGYTDIELVETNHLFIGCSDRSKQVSYDYEVDLATGQQDVDVRVCVGVVTDPTIQFIDKDS